MQDKRQRWAQNAHNSQTEIPPQPTHTAPDLSTGSSLRVGATILVVILIGIWAVAHFASEPSNAHAANAAVAADTTHKPADSAKKP